MNSNYSLCDMATATRVLVWLGLALVPTGCGSNAPQAPPVNTENLAQAKVKAFRQLADEMAKSPGSVGVAGALEEYRTLIPFSPEESPKQAEEILEIYRQRIQGKYNDEYARQVQDEVQTIRAHLKQRKK